VEPTFKAIAEIAADNRSGAAQIAERAANILLQRAASGQAPSADAFRHEILAIGRALIRAQMVMAPLVNLVNAVLWRMEQGDSPRSLSRAVEQTTEEFKRQIQQHALHVAEGTLGLIDEGSQIVTLSFSSTIQHALIHAQRAGRRLEVLCAESQPGREGRDTATVLRSCGVAAILLDDESALAAVEHADLVLVGADMLTHRGLINKVGTAPMALAAHTAGTPFYTLCGSEKFLPPGFRPGNRSISWANNGDAVEAYQLELGDLPFDFTPLELLSGIVTEKGILPVAAIEAWLAATQLHPALAQHSAEVAL